MSRLDLNHTALAALAIVASQISNCFGAAWSKSLFSAVGPEGIVALRLGFSALLLGLLTRVWQLRVDGTGIRDIVAYGLALGLMNSVAYQAYARIPVGVGMAIEVTGPLALVLYHSRRGRDLLWVACMVGGLAMLLIKDSGEGRLDLLGIGFAFCSAVCWATYIVFGKRVSNLGSGRVVAAGMLVASLFAVPYGGASVGGTLLQPKWLALGLAIAILSSAFPFFLQILALRWLPQRVYGLLASAVPATGALMGFLVLGEALEARQWLGILLVVCASAGSTLAVARHK
ncbi:MAG: EamA family transporter [Alphaproteobacteria bacterium]|nr:EamA family transporter [Alphaproteobacteria bacterium]